MKIKIGPAGLGSVKEACNVLEEFAGLGFKCCEIPFTRNVYIRNQEDAERIGKKAKELGIDLSIHGSYFINLSSAEDEKIEASKERILSALKVGTWLGAKRVVFHPGYYGKLSKNEVYEKVRDAILDLQKRRKELGYTPKLAPETTGKKNVFGGLKEIARLVTDTGCSFCIDFAHILARNGSYRFDDVFELFKDEKKFHIHFSGIEYGDKGEKRHLQTEEKEWRRLLKRLRDENKNFTIISEAPNSVEGALDGLNVLKELSVTNT